MKTIQFAAVLAAATLLLASMACTRDAAAASEPQTDPEAGLSPAQQRAVEAYAESQASAANGVYTEVVRSVVADLDGDGKPEVVAEINTYMGNSHFGRLVVFVDTGNGLQKVAQSEAPLGLVEGVDVAEGLIRVASRWPAPNDPRCCPSMEKTTHYRWHGDTVTEAASGAAAPAVNK